MAGSFSHENAAYCMDLLGSLERFAGDSKKDKSKTMQNFKQRTTGMEVIVPYAEMGKVCVQMKSVADYHLRKEK
eukprot:12962243-Heterocapsa_arctica.AAC.1